MTILYLAWLRARAGCAQETIEGDFADLGALVDHLRRLRPGLDEPLEQGVVRFAVNQEFAALDHPVRSGDEIALLPPITGG